MMRHILSLTAGLLLSIILVLAMAGCGKESNSPAEEMTDPTTAFATDSNETGAASDATIETFSYSHTGIAADENYAYTAEAVSEGCTLTVTVEGINDIYTQTVDSSFLDKLMKGINDNEVRKWDGFHKVDSTVNTIDEFALEVTFSDGTSIDAGGSCIYPDNYEDFTSLISDIFGPHKTSMIQQYQASDGAERPEIIIGSSYNHYYSEDHDQIIARVTYPVINLSDDSSPKYPKLDNALDELNSSLASDYESSFNELKAGALEQLETSQEYIPQYACEEQAHTVRADSNIVSIVSDIYFYSGGFHPDTSIYAYNYDSKTGKTLELKDVASDPQKLLNLLPGLLKSQYGEETFYVDLDEYMEKVLTGEYSQVWTINNESIVFYFNPYDIAPYAAGLISVSVPFRNNESLFQSSVIPCEDSFVTELSNYSTYETDLDNNGTADKISLWFSRIVNDVDIFQNYDEVTITVNDYSLTHENYSFANRVFHVRTENSKNYLYIETMVENDYKIWYIYKLSRDGAAYVGSVSGSIDNFSDSENFEISEPMSLFGTFFATKHYHINGTGMPETDDEYYTIESGYDEINVMLPFEGVLLDEVGEPTGEKIRIEAGGKALPVRTDNKTYCDLTVGNKQLRVYVDGSDWPHTIDGVDIQSIFQGIIFAG